MKKCYVSWLALTPGQQVEIVTHDSTGRLYDVTLAKSGIFYYLATFLGEYEQLEKKTKNKTGPYPNELATHLKIGLGMKNFKTLFKFRVFQ